MILLIQSHQADMSMSAVERLLVLSVDMDWLIDFAKGLLAALRELERMLTGGSRPVGLLSSGQPELIVLPGRSEV
jgi:hypothetical protein